MRGRERRLRGSPPSTHRAIWRFENSHFPVVRVGGDEAIRAVTPEPWVARPKPMNPQVAEAAKSVHSGEWCSKCPPRGPALGARGAGLAAGRPEVVLRDYAISEMRIFLPRPRVETVSSPRASRCSRTCFARFSRKLLLGFRPRWCASRSAHSRIP